MPTNYPNTSHRPLHCTLVCGARPNFMKIASLVDAFRDSGRVESFLVHTGQHYDANMSALFFGDLGLPEPNVNLGCEGAGHARQTADIMQRFEPVLLQRRPDRLIVVGDVTSTLACALVAAKLGIPVAHVEAGLRSFDRSMPEEINRVLTDQLSDLLFVTEPAGMANLAREGIDPARCHLVGDTMADTLLKHLPRASSSSIRRTLDLEQSPYALLTLHRAANVDDPAVLAEIVEGIVYLASKLTVVFPVHPRTAQRLDAAGLRAFLARSPGMRLIEPLGYLDFLKLMSEARLMVTDSGGIQEETTILGTACLTLRETTERPYTVEIGTNRLVAPRADVIRRAVDESLAAPPRPACRSPLTDGAAGRRIADIILAHSAAEPRPCLSEPRP